MDAHESTLQTAMLAYTTAVLAAVDEAGLSIPPLSSRVMGWVPTGNDEYTYNVLPSEPAGQFAGVLRQHQGSPEHQECVAALRAHPVISPRLDQLVGTELGATRLQADSVPNRVLSRMEARDEFDRAFREVYQWLVREEDTYFLIAPLPKLALNDGPIRLEDRVELDQMTEQEMVACLTWGLIQGGGPNVLVHATPGAAVRVEQTFPLVISDRPPTDRQQVEETWERWNGLIDATVLALRLYKAGEMPTAGAVYMSPDTLSTHPFRPHAARPERRGSFVLSADDAARLRTLWKALRAPATPHPTSLQTALRRFGFAGERARPEDRVLDLMIAAEAVFVPKEITESAFKLSLRGAAFLAELGEPQAEVFTHLKRAYGARSKLAHGEEVRRLMRADDSEATLSDYATLVADYLRKVLRRMVEEGGRGDAYPKDGPGWDNFVLARLRRPK